MASRLASVGWGKPREANMLIRCQLIHFWHKYKITLFRGGCRGTLYIHYKKAALLKYQPGREYERKRVALRPDDEAEYDVSATVS